MRKWPLILLLLALSALVLSPAALAGTPEAAALWQAFPQAPPGGKALTRGEFAALLIRAAGIDASPTAPLPDDVAKEQWYAPAVATLNEKGILRGYPGVGVQPEQPVTLLEAAVMASRSLGLPDTAQAPTVEGSLDRENWGYTPYAWLVRVGVLDASGDIGAALTVDEGIAFLSRVFGSDPEAEKIIEAASKTQAGIKSVKFSGSMGFTARPRPGMEKQMPSISIQGTMESELIYPLTLHQKMNMFTALPLENQLPGLGTPDGKLQTTLEQYLVDGALYQEVEIPGLAPAQWMKIPKSALPDLESMVEQTRKSAAFLGGLPPELSSYFHYRYLGEGEFNGRKVYHIAYYGRIDDWQTFMKLALPQGMGSGLEQAMSQAGSMLQSISYWGEEAIDTQDYLPMPPR